MPESTPALYPDRNLALALVRVTEAAVMVAGRWVGRGAKNLADGADGADVAAMRTLIVERSRSGTIHLLEGHHVLDRTAGLRHPAEL
jgi:fructose-1,6-bisphosphatase II